MPEKKKCVKPLPDGKPCKGQCMVFADYCSEHYLEKYGRNADNLKIVYLDALLQKK